MVIVVVLALVVAEEMAVRFGIHRSNGDDNRMKRKRVMTDESED